MMTDAHDIAEFDRLEIDTAASMATCYAEVAQRASRLLAQTLKRLPRKTPALSRDQLQLAKTFMDMSAKLLANPYRLAQTQLELLRDHLLLWQQATLKAMGLPARAVTMPDEGDRRFRDQAWEEHFLFDFLKQSYLLSSRHLQAAVAHIAVQDTGNRSEWKSMTERYVAAMSPSNFALTNPKVLRVTAESQGRNLIKGLKTLLADLEQEEGLAACLDSHSWRVGVNLATTPGKVIFENAFLQLIQYQPTTPEQYAEPLLIVPPWINRYYLFDLRASNSFVKWTTDHGFTTFVISWGDPDRKIADSGLDAYFNEGMLAAIDAVQRATGAQKIHLAGYCLGGTLLMATLAWLAAKNDPRAASATFLASLIDFSDGLDEAHADHPQIAEAETRIRADLESPLNPLAFRLQHAHDLLWSFIVDRYLLGKGPIPADLLYWSGDSNRVPASLHRFVLENLVEGNRLATGTLRLTDVTLDMARVRTPCYFLALSEDRISPWQSAYRGARLPGGPVRFTLSGAGHVTGLIDPPSTSHHTYWTNDRLPDEPEAFLRAATAHTGSWWTDWRQWLLALDGANRQVSARTPGEGQLSVIEEAPGRFVRRRPTFQETHPK